VPPDRPTDESEHRDGQIEIQAVHTRDKKITNRKIERRRRQLEDSVARYLAQFDTADRKELLEALAAKTAHLKEKLVKLTAETEKLKAYETEMLGLPDQRLSHRSGRRIGGDQRAWLRRPGL
jgi:hypothetical protein